MASQREKSIDLNEAVKLWAWKEYDSVTTWKQRRLRSKEKKNPGHCIAVNIDWSDVAFEDKTTWPRLAEMAFDINENTTTGGTEMKAETGKPHTSMLFLTKYTNNTNSPQEYMLKTERRTLTTCETEIETSFTKGIEMGVTLKTPGELFEANVGYSREMSLTKSTGETLEEELVWGVESQIQVEKNSEAIAKLVVLEKKYDGDFKIESKIHGQVYVTFLNIKDNNSHIKGTSRSIYNIMKDYLEVKRRLGAGLDFVDIDEDTETVTIITKGVCNFRHGVNQEVNVDSVSLA